MNGAVPVRRRTVALGIAAVAIAIAIGYGESLRGDFVLIDDVDFVRDNPYVQGGLTREGMAWAFGLSGRVDYFFPLAWVSLMAGRDLLGPDAWAFHLLNVVHHAATSVLLLLVLVRSTRRFGAALAATLLFAVHPLTVEGVTWIFERKICLSGTLGMGAILAYVWHAERPSAARLALVTSLQGLSLLARPTIVILPGLLLLLDVWPLRRLRVSDEPGERFPRASARTLLLEKVPLLTVSLVVTATVFHFLSGLPVADLPLGLRIANAFATVPDYLGAAFWPSDLTIFRPYPTAVPAGAVAVGVAVLAAGFALAFVFVRSAPYAMVGWLWFLVCLVPHAGIKQNGLWPEWADRFAYFALIGLAIAVAFAADDLLARIRVPRLAVIALAASAVLALTVATRTQVRTWRDNIALFTRGAELYPGDWMNRYWLGTALLLEGRADEAEREFVAALAANPSYASAWAQLGTIRFRRGQGSSAEQCYRRSLELEPSNPESLYSLAEILRTTGRGPLARPLYARFAEVAPLKYVAQRRRALQRAAKP